MGGLCRHEVRRARITPPLFSKSASNHWDTQIKSTRPHTHDAFQNEFVRQTETSRDQISNASRKNQQLSLLIWLKTSLSKCSGRIGKSARNRRCAALSEQ